jgi:type I restriction enzyme S subunit
MSVPDGFKVSEVGVIPVDWDVKRLGDIALVSSGGTPNRSNPSYWNGNIPWITTTQIDFNIITYSNEFITEMGLKNSSAKIYNKNTLLMAMYGQGKTRGKIAILGIDASVNQACAAININKDICNKYLFFYLASNYEEIRKLSNTGNQENLNGKIIKSISIPLPPLAEQKAIAQSLSDVDNLITAIDKLITKKRNIKQGTMQELLTGKKRLPGFSGEWEVKKLGDIADSKIKWSITGGPFGSNLKSSDYTQDGIRIIQLQNIGDGIFIDDYKIYTSENKANELLSCNIYPGEIILSKMGDPVARACFIPNIENRYLMCSDGIRLVVDELHFDKRFIHDYINSKYFRNQAIEASTGSTRMRIGLQDLKKLTLSIPPLPEQKAIAKILTEIDEEIEALEKKREKYKNIKQGMMQELLTGKTRIIDN